MALIEVELMSECLNRKVAFKAIIPFENSERIEPFKTLYLLHCLKGSYSDWINETSIVRLAKSRKLAVVMPAGENKFYIDNETNGSKYGEFIGSELVESTRTLFNLSTKREDTFISGASMGGYGAIRNGLKYNNTFGRIAAFSSALILEDAVTSTTDGANSLAKRNEYESVFGDLNKLLGSDKDPKALIKDLKSRNQPIPKLYLCCGANDFLIHQNREYHKFLLEQKVDHIFEDGEGEHNWDYFSSNLERVLDWILE